MSHNFPYHKKPKSMRLPRQYCSREGVAKLLLDDRTPRYYGGNNWLLCWDVKCHFVDLSYENLVERHLAAGHRDRDEFMHTDYQNALQKAFWEQLPERYDGLGNEGLWEWAIEGARDTFVDGDAFKTTWNGETLYEIEYGFYGRSGGWLVMESFNGVTLHTDSFVCMHDARDRWVELAVDEHIRVPAKEGGMTWKAVRDLAEIVHTLNGYLTPQTVAEEVETAAAWVVFEQVLADVPSPIGDKRFAEAEESRRVEQLNRIIRTSRRRIIRLED